MAAMESGGGETRMESGTEEDELKRNTDCVYFLASPLTCKKGSECEYRHSEGARMNPRDCWFWFNASCLNPKCSFRHPPLDGIYGIRGAMPGSAQPPLQSAANALVPTAHAAAYTNKQNVPCYYFQKGCCLKGDRCSFMHGQQPAGNTDLQPAATASAFPSDPPSKVATEKWTPKKCTSQINAPKENVDKSVETLPSLGKPILQVESVPHNVSEGEHSASPYLLQDELPEFELNVPFNSDNALGWPQSRVFLPMDDHLQNGKETDEFLRESSPGFDVLVDDHMEDSEYFQNEDDYGRAPGQGGMKLNLMNEYDYQHSDYEPVPCLESDQYNEMREYDRYGHLHERYSRERLGTFSERTLERPLKPEKKMSRQEGSYDKIDMSDLRHRLTKQRRLNGLRSVVSPDYHRDPYINEERSRTWHSYWDHQLYSKESSISGRLRGRLTLPVRSSQDQPVDLRLEIERDTRHLPVRSSQDRPIDLRLEIERDARHQSRLSPTRQISYQFRHQERIKRRLNGDISSNAKMSSRHALRRDDEDSLDFAPPKSLAELKSAKVSESSLEQKDKYGKALGHHMSKDSLSFEGPKPLSDILKRKRENAPGNGLISSYGDQGNQAVALAEDQFDSQWRHLLAPQKGQVPTRLPEASKVTSGDEEEEGMIPAEGEDFFKDDQRSSKYRRLESEYGMIGHGMDDQEPKNYDDQGDEGYDYEADCEAAEEGGCKTKDYENNYLEDEEDGEDEDGDDFAKKVGVVLS